MIIIIIKARINLQIYLWKFREIFCLFNLKGIIKYIMKKYIFENINQFVYPQ